MKTRQVKDLLYIPNEADVSMSSWRASRGGLLMTGGAFTCVVAAVHIPEESVGYLGHFAALDPPEGLYGRPVFTDTDRFDEMIEIIKREHQAKKVAVWLGAGAVRPTEPDHTGGLAQRAYAESRIKELNVDEPNLIIAWERGCRSTDVLLDCRSGDLLFQKEDQIWED